MSEIWHSKKNDCRLSRTQVNNTILPNSIFTKNNIALIKNIDKIALTTIIAFLFNPNIDILLISNQIVLINKNNLRINIGTIGHR